ncbi:hypothetical protein Tco_0906864 [Tanacetum coccineum]|uniref:Uncharacterized protein n=1 Tax=Tanacetum coccineum TaxID=301880 RepID=A0ABQ5CNU5_9ASTR
MVINSPCLIDNKELTSPEQTAPGKDFSNPLIVDSLLKTIWSSMHHVFTMKHWLVQSKRLLHESVYNMKGPIKGYSARMLALIPTMIDLLQPSTSPTRIPSSPTLLPEHSPSPTPSHSPEPTPAHTTADVTQPSPTQPSPTHPSPTQPSPTQPEAEHHVPTPHDSPLHAVHSHGSDEVLEAALMQTKKTYVLLIRSLFSWSKAKSHIKIGKKGGQARVVLSDDKSPMKIILQTWEKYLMQSSRKSNQEPVCPRKEKKYDQILKNQGNYQDRVTFQAKSPEKEKSPEKNVEEEVDTTIKMKEGCKRNWSKEKESIPEKATRKSQKMEEER